MATETDKRPMGRPRRYAEPRRRLTLELPDELVGALDILVQQLRDRHEVMDDSGTVPSRTNYIEMLLANDLHIRKAAAKWREEQKP